MLSACLVIFLMSTHSAESKGKSSMINVSLQNNRLTAELKNTLSRPIKWLDHVGHVTWTLQFTKVGSNETVTGQDERVTMDIDMRVKPEHQKTIAPGAKKTYSAEFTTEDDSRVLHWDFFRYRLSPGEYKVDVMFHERPIESEGEAQPITGSAVIKLK